MNNGFSLLALFTALGALIYIAWRWHQNRRIYPRNTHMWNILKRYALWSVILVGLTFTSLFDHWVQFLIWLVALIVLILYTINRVGMVHFWMSYDRPGAR